MLVCFSHITLIFSTLKGAERFKGSRLGGTDGPPPPGHALCRWYMGGLSGTQSSELGEHFWVKTCMVTVKGLEGVEEVPPQCEESAAEFRIRVRGWSPSCAEDWQDWRKQLIYWYR